MSSSRLREAGSCAPRSMHDLIVIGVSCTEEVVGVRSLQGLDSHREIGIRGRWQSVGGNGLNVAVHAARLGADVSLISKIPRDIWPEVTGSLKAAGVNSAHLVPDYVNPSPKVLLIADDKGDYCVFVSDRTGIAFTPAEVAAVKGLHGRFVHIDGFTLGALAVESQVQAAQLWLDMAAKSPATLSLDLNRAICDSQPERVRQLVKQADILFANAYEAMAVTDVGSTGEAARKLVDWGIPFVVVKDGERGIICATSARVDHMPAIDVSVADSIGAGDGVVAGTLSGLMRGLELHEAAKIGTAVAALVCSGHGSQGADFVWSDVKQLLRAA